MIKYSNNSNIVENIAPLILYDGNTKAWFDLDNSVITKDGSDRVSSWGDRSGNNNHLLQATDSKKPIWSNTGIKFDGSDDWLEASFTHTNPVSRYTVFSMNWAITGYIIDGVTANGVAALQMRTAFSKVDLLGNAVALIGNTDIKNGVKSVIKAIYDTSNGLLQSDYNAAVGGNLGGNFDAGGIVLGARSDKNYPAEIEINELIDRNICDTPTNQFVITEYLQRIHKTEILKNRFNKGYVVFAFDDGRIGVYTQGKNYFLNKGVMPTYYVTGEYSNYGHPLYITWSEAKELQDAGFDIQCHAYTHISYYAEEWTEEQVLTDLDANTAAFQAANMIPPVEFAYPRGASVGLGSVPSWVAQRRNSGRVTMRLYEPNLIYLNTDRYYLPAIPIDKSSNRIDLIKEIIYSAYKSNTAVFLYAHGIKAFDTADDDTYSIRLNELDEFINYAQSIGIEIITHSQLIDIYDNLNS